VTRQTLLGNICPMFGDEDCRFLSQERTSRPFTRLDKDEHTGMYKPVGMGSRKVVLGMMCNNAPIGSSGWVDDLHYCPARWALHRGVTKKEGKRK
jgi:hypothetical protein